MQYNIPNRDNKRGKQSKNYQPFESETWLFLSSWHQETVEKTDPKAGVVAKKKAKVIVNFAMEISK